MEKIVIVEDDECIREELKQLLCNAGYDARYLVSFEDASNEIIESQPDLVLLDMNLPGINGLTICDQIRRKGNIPIIFVTGNTTSMDELNCIMRGGDDYIAKPYQVPILLARIAALLRRTNCVQSAEQKEESILEYQDLCLNMATAFITFQARKIEVTKNELKILYQLFLHKEEIVSRETLIDFLWDEQIFIDDNALSVHMTRIRNKLEEIGAGGFIETKRGMGYILAHETEN